MQTSYSDDAVSINISGQLFVFIYIRKLTEKGEIIHINLLEHIIHAVSFCESFSKQQMNQILFFTFKPDRKAVHDPKYRMVHVT